MNKKQLSKILSIFMGSATLLIPISILSSCQQQTQETNSTSPENDSIKQKNIKLKNGIADWSDFLSMALIEKININENGTEEKIISWDGIINNKNEIKGFSGYANYEEIKSFLSSPYNTKIYNSQSLDIYFNYIPKDQEGIEITPSILDAIYKVFDTINISNINKSKEKTPIKFSSGDANNPEIFDIEKYYTKLTEGKLSIKKDSIITQSTTSINLIGVEDPYLKNTKITNNEKLIYLINSPLFQNSKIDIVNIEGNIKNILPLLKKEHTKNNISFSKNTYYKSNKNEIDNLTLDEIKEIIIRGGNTNLSSVNISGNNFINDNTINFSNSTLTNVTFEKDVNLSDIPFDFVKSKETLNFKCILPNSIKYLEAENLIFDGAITNEKGTNITGSQIENLNIIELQNPENLIKDENALKGNIKKFKGTKKMYEIFQNIFNISQDDIKLDIITQLILENKTQNYC